MTHDIEFLLGLLALVVVGAALARAIHVPYPIVLLGLGLGVAFIPGMPDITIDPEVIFLVFLPPLLHAAAYDTNLRNLRRDARPIALLAVGLVAVTGPVVVAVESELDSEMARLETRDAADAGEVAAERLPVEVP